MYPNAASLLSYVWIKKTTLTQSIVSEVLSRRIGKEV